MDKVADKERDAALMFDALNSLDWRENSKNSVVYASLLADLANLENLGEVKEELLDSFSCYTGIYADAARDIHAQLEVSGF